MNMMFTLLIFAVLIPVFVPACFGALPLAHSIPAVSRIVAVLVPFMFSAVVFIFANEAQAHNGHEGQYPLHNAVSNEDVSTVAHLLEGGHDFDLEAIGETRVNTRPFFGTPLMVAASAFYFHGRTSTNRKNYLAIVDLLLDAGAMVKTKDEGGYTALHFSLGMIFDLANRLLQAGANVNAKTNNGDTALHLAFGRGQLDHISYDFIEKMLQAGADISAKDRLGNTPLHLAVGKRNDANVNFLLVNNAQVNLHNADGKTPLDIAREIQQNDIALKLQQSGARTGEDVVGVSNQFLLLQLRADLVSLRMEIESLKAEMNRICGAISNCAQAAMQRSALANLENQVGRKTSEVAALFPSGGSGGGSSNGSGEGGGSSGIAIGLGAAALLGIAVYALSPAGDAEAFSLRPLVSYEYRDGAEALHYGMRLDYRQDSWGLWWSADDSSLGWGGEWRNDRLRAHAEVWDVGGAQDVSAGLGAKWKLAGWSVHPSWRMRGSAGSEGVWTWDSGADLTAEWSGHGWMVRPSVRALNVENPADALFRLRVAREF